MLKGLVRVEVRVEFSFGGGGGIKGCWVKAGMGADELGKGKG